jgi:hypothetical protein
MGNLMTDFDKELIKSLAAALEAWRKEFNIPGESPLVQMARVRLEQLESETN